MIMNFKEDDNVLAQTFNTSLKFKQESVPTALKRVELLVIFLIYYPVRKTTLFNKRNDSIKLTLILLELVHCIIQNENKLHLQWNLVITIGPKEITLLY